MRTVLDLFEMLVHQLPVMFIPQRCKMGSNGRQLIRTDGGRPHAL
jgi:hypothetical protein